MLLSVSHIKKSFGDLSVLSDISFSIERGEHFALVGRNGSGKTTLLNIIAGILSNDDGVVALEKDARIGYLPQYVDTVMEGSLLIMFFFQERTSFPMKKNFRKWKMK